MAKIEHKDCNIYRGCPACRRNQDRLETYLIVLAMIFVFTAVIPVIPAIIAIIFQIV